jgi:hypothetical protein
MIMTTLLIASETENICWNSSAIEAKSHGGSFEGGIKKLGAEEDN